MMVSNFTTKWTLVYFSKTNILVYPQESFCKVWDQLDTRLNNDGLISSQSMLIYHLKLKSVVYLGNGGSDRKNNDIFDPKGLK